VVVGIGEVAGVWNYTAIGVVAVVMCGLAILLGQPGHVALEIVVIPVHLPRGSGGEVVHRADATHRASVEVVALAIEESVLGHRVQAVEDIFGALIAAATYLGIVSLHQSPPVAVILKRGERAIHAVVV